MKQRTATLLVCALSVMPLCSAAADLPKRKSGLWEISVSLADGQGAPPMQMCIDEKTDDVSRQMVQGLNCSKQDIRREGDRYVAESVCKIEQSTVTSRAVFSGKFDTAYQVDIDAKYTPPLMDMSQSKTTMKARWLGPCKSGQRAGDMVLPDGRTINAFDAGKAAPKK